jgi:hypothetical protein
MVLPRAEIDRWMTDQLRSIAGCAGSELKVGYRLQEPDATGCNWTSASPGFVTPGPDITPCAVVPMASEVVNRARALFNLAL